ncbi:MAG: hypothetical protein U5M23_14740 [Marinagarivorans sp.]|nr:hypothetical protein [Marinagarivorans sp.]
MTTLKGGLAAAWTSFRIIIYGHNFYRVFAITGFTFLIRFAGYEVISVPHLAVSFIAELSPVAFLIKEIGKNQEPTLADGQK